MASFWCKVACDLDNHPKIRRAGNLGSQVFQYALRKNASPGNPVPGLLPEAVMDAWYIADQLQMTEAEAQQGIQQACVAGLLAPAERAFRIVGWDDGEWGRGDQSGGRHVGGRARAEKAKRAPNGAFLPSNVQQSASNHQVENQLDQQPAKTEDGRRKTEDVRRKTGERETRAPESKPMGMVVALPNHEQAKWVNARWDEINAHRLRIAREHGIANVRPLHDQDRGRVQLAQRRRDGGDRAVADIEHVIAVRVAEAEATASVRWLSGSMFDEKSFAIALAMTPDDARRGRGTAKPNQDVRVGRIEPVTDYPDGEQQL